jgi:hypothetical protein
MGWLNRLFGKGRTSFSDDPEGVQLQSPDPETCEIEQPGVRVSAKTRQQSSYWWLCLRTGNRPCDLLQRGHCAVLRIDAPWNPW